MKQILFTTVTLLKKLLFFCQNIYSLIVMPHTMGPLKNFLLKYNKVH